MTGSVGPDAANVADGFLKVGGRDVRYKDRMVWQGPEDRGRPSLPYDARGRLEHCNHFDRQDAGPERFFGWGWRPGQADRFSPSGPIASEIGKMGEFSYALSRIPPNPLDSVRTGLFNGCCGELLIFE